MKLYRSFVTVGGLTVSVMSPRALLTGITRAYVGPRTTLFAGAVTVGATDDFGYHAVSDVVTAADLAGLRTALLG